MEDGIDAIGGLEGPTSSVQLADITSEASKNAEINDATVDALQNAIQQAATLPGEHKSTEHDTISGHPDGDYSDEIGSVTSDVEREGVPSTADDETDEVEVVAQTLRELTRELTNWQVTWGVAQAAQKDLSHVLKSQ